MDITRLLLVPLALALWPLTAEAAAGPRTVRYPIHTMGTYAHIHLVTPDSVASIPTAALAAAELTGVDDLMSNWSGTSEVARINRIAPEGPVRPHPRVAELLTLARWIGQESDGAFDITVEPLVRSWGFLGGPPHVPTARELHALLPAVGPERMRWNPDTGTLVFTHPRTRIDLGGIAKGYGVDRAAAALLEAGVTHALIDLSGNMTALGHPPGRTAWQVGVRDPRDRIATLGTLALRDGALATSGTYEQFVAVDGKTYGHILDPATGRPVDGLLSVTVMAPSAAEADAWSTAIFVLGPRTGLRLAAAREDISVVLVEPSPARHQRDIVWVEADLASRFTLGPNASELFEVRVFGGEVAGRD